MSPTPVALVPAHVPADDLPQEAQPASERPLAELVGAVHLFQRAFEAAFPQRQDAIRALLLADICPVPCNVLFTGPPGVAKTAIVKQYARAFSHKLLSVAMSEHTDDTRLLGPYSIAELRNDRVVRGKSDRITFQTATMAFVDEIGRAGRGCKDLLLEILAERIAEDDHVDAHVVVAATNQALSDEADRALVDRCGLKVNVGRVTGKDLSRVIFRGVPKGGTAPVSHTLPALPEGTIEVLRGFARTVSFPQDVSTSIESIALALRGPAPEGTTYPDVSERRWIIATHILQAAATIDGRSEVTFQDLVNVLPLVLNDDDANRSAVRGLIDDALPRYLVELQNLRAACEDALAVTKRIHEDGQNVAPVTAKQHQERAKTLEGMAQLVAQHGTDAGAQAAEMVRKTLDECDDIAIKAIKARRSGRTS